MSTLPRCDTFWKTTKMTLFTTSEAFWKHTKPMKSTELIGFQHHKSAVQDDQVAPAADQLQRRAHSVKTTTPHHFHFSCLWTILPTHSEFYHNHAHHQTSKHCTQTATLYHGKPLTTTDKTKLVQVRWENFHQNHSWGSNPVPAQ